MLQVGKGFFTVQMTTSGEAGKTFVYWYSMQQDVDVLIEGIDGMSVFDVYLAWM